MTNPPNQPAPEVCPKCGAVRNSLILPEHSGPFIYFACGSSIDTFKEPGEFQQAESCVNVLLKQQLAAMTKGRDAMHARLEEIRKGCESDEADLAKMRDGTKLTRSGLVTLLVYQQQDIAELKALLTRIYGWDVMDSAADGPYWREEMQNLGIRHPDPARKPATETLSDRTLPITEPQHLAERPDYVDRERGFWLGEGLGATNNDR